MKSYEQNRLENIRRNQAILQSLGLAKPSKNLKKAVKNRIPVVHKRKIVPAEIKPREKSKRIRRKKEEPKEEKIFFHNLHWQSSKKIIKYKKITTLSIFQHTSQLAWIAGHKDGSLKFYFTLSTKKEFDFSCQHFKAHETPICGSVFIGNILLTASEDGDVKSWDLTKHGSSKLLSTTNFGNGVTALTGIGCGAVIGKSDGSVHLFDFKSKKKQRYRLETSLGSISLLEVHPFKDVLAVCGNDEVHFYDTTKLKTQKPFRIIRIGESVQDIKFSPDGKYFVSVTQTGKFEARLFEIQENATKTCHSLSSGNIQTTKLKGNIVFFPSVHNAIGHDTVAYPHRKGLQILKINQKNLPGISKEVRVDGPTFSKTTFLGYHAASECFLDCKSTGRFGFWVNKKVKP